MSNFLERIVDQLSAGFYPEHAFRFRVRKTPFGEVYAILLVNEKDVGVYLFHERIELLATKEIESIEDNFNYTLLSLLRVLDKLLLPDGKITK